MAKDFIDYNQLVEQSLRDVPRRALKRVSETGPVGSHHFYVTFRTQAPGVVLSDRLRARHPDEMTIVLQHEFWGLEVSEVEMSVTLSFGGVSERLTIPFAAMLGFADPSANFALQFGPRPAAIEAQPAPASPKQATESQSKDQPRPEEAAAKEGTVVTLDSFRKK